MPGLKPPEVRSVPKPEKVGTVHGLVEKVRGFRSRRTLQRMRESSQAGLLSHDNPRSTLEFISRTLAPGSALRALDDQISFIEGQANLRKIDPRKAEAKINKLEAKKKVAEARAKEVDLLVQDLVDNGKTPQQRVLGIDIKKSIVNRNIHSIQEAKKQLEIRSTKEGVTDEFKDKARAQVEEYDNYLKQQAEELTRLHEQRDTMGKDLPDEVALLAGQLSGRVLTETELENPWGVMEKIFSESAGNPEALQALTGKMKELGISISDSDISDLKAALDPKVPVDKKRLAIYSALLLIGGSYLLTKGASQEHKQGQQGGYGG